MDVPLCGFDTHPSKEGYGFPGPNSSQWEWEQCFPIMRLPRLPDRGRKYYTEPMVGIAVTVVCVSLLAGLTVAAVTPEMGQLAVVLQLLICTWAVIAVGSVGFILLGKAGEIERTPQTCYPIPIQVAECLARGHPLDNVRNQDGPYGSSYCVRCLVWRPGCAEKGPSHHCSICSRCVWGFDHHCNVFGRCIVKANMRCFYAMIAMLCAGVITTAIAMSSGTPDSPLNLGPEFLSQRPPPTWGTQVLTSMSPPVGGMVQTSTPPSVLN